MKRPGDPPVQIAELRKRADSWREAAFLMEVAQETEKRRETARMGLAIALGVALGIVGAGVSQFGAIAAFVSHLVGSGTAG